MKTNFTFQDAQNLVSNHYSELKEDFNVIINLLILATPFFITCEPATTLTAIGMLSDFLGVKEGVTKVGERLFNKITERFEDEVDRYRRMQIAYTLICFTAFFDTLEKELPDIKKSLNLKPSEKEWLSKGAIEKLRAQQKESDKKRDSIEQFPDIISKEIHLPHPIGSLDSQESQFLAFYEELSNGFGIFLEKFTIWEKTKEHKKGKIKEVLKKLPNLARERYEAQYFQLCVKYQEFYIWANLHERKASQEKISVMSDYVQEYVKLVDKHRENIDVGMAEVSSFAKLLPKLGSEYQANKTTEELKKLYLSRIEELVVKDIEGNAKQFGLTYPKKSEIFIPQSFQAIRYLGKPLEDEITWQKASERDDLGTFLLAYFSSPYSEKSPLIILGHPGSGKSLLSNIITARLIQSPYTPIRVALRDVEADNEISVQIEEQIKKDTNRKVSWAELTDTFDSEPALVILDGYDELLQASGKVHAGYLRKVQKFQENEIQLGRKPVRTIITSRVTLIDKADIPENATIIRLKPFDNKKREKWAAIWNKVNYSFFEQNKIRPFKISMDKKILELAEQPLLLLMLAIYDSENNSLQNTKELDQTILYDRLLRRFIGRELEKDTLYLNLPSNERDQEVDKEMERLGIVALGMFNRRKLHIKVSELNKDLSFFKLERSGEESSGVTLSQADLLLGSFFFVHESKSSNVDSETGNRNRDIAFEFLHNTFGEFLAAEYFLRRIIKMCKTLYQLRIADLNEEYSNKLQRPDDFPVICLAYAPIFSRPVIIQMLREWLKHKLPREQLPLDAFLYELDATINAEIQRILSKSRLSDVLTGMLENNPFPTYPITGHMAIYSLNLILLRVILTPKEYIFDENKVVIHSDGTRPWDRLNFLWRSWFSIENLNGLTNILEVHRSKDKVILKIQNSADISPNIDRFDALVRTSSVLGDNILTGLAGLHKFDPTNDKLTDLDRLHELLILEGINLKDEYLHKKLRYYIFQHTGNKPNKLFDEIEIAFQEYPSINEVNISTLCLLIKDAVEIAHILVGEYKAISVFDSFYMKRVRHDMPDELIILAVSLGKAIHHKDFLEWFVREFPRQLLRQNTNPKLLLELFRLSRDFRDEHFDKRIYEEYLHKFDLRRTNPELLIEMIKLSKDFGDEHFAEHIYEKYLREIDPRKTNPELLIDMIKLAKEFKDERYAELIYEKALREITPSRSNPRRTNPELAIELIKLAKEFKDEHYTERIFREFISEINLRAANQEMLIEIIRFASEIRAKSLSEDAYRYLRESNNRNMGFDLSIKILHLAQDLNDRELLDLVPADIQNEIRSLGTYIARFK